MVLPAKVAASVPPWGRHIITWENCPGKSASGGSKESRLSCDWGTVTIASMRRNVVVSVLALVAGLLLGIWWMREPTVPLTAGVLDEARDRWNRHGPSSYRLRYKMNRDSYDVVVQDGIVIEATVNQQRPRTDNLRAYSMDGLFDLLLLELEAIGDPMGPFSGRAETFLARVRFHPEDGHVERYIRNSAGVAIGAQIQVLQFERLQSDSEQRLPPGDVPGQETGG